MTVKEFWEYVDTIDIDSREDGRYTEDEMFDIGKLFKSLNNSQKREIGGWDYLITVLKPLDKDGNVMTKGDTFRQWIKDRCYKYGEMEPNVHLLSGKTIDKLSFDEFQGKADEIVRDIYKQEIKNRDTLNEYRRLLRTDARSEVFWKMLSDSIEHKEPLKEVKLDRIMDAAPETEAIVLFSDMHLGVTVNKYFNVYNTEIARKRVQKYVDNIIDFCKINKVQKLHFLNLGDNIAGLIHVNGRLVQEMDVIDQITTACEVLADVLNQLQAVVPEVYYRSVTDNHSRAMPNYKENLETENYGRIIDFYLEARLKDTNVIFAHDNLDEEVGMFSLNNGQKVLFVHGHHDNYNVICQNFMGATREFIDYILLGHYHNSKVKTFQGAKVIVNGSIVGTDSYAYSKRLFGDPEQTVLLFKGKNLSVNYVNLALK